MEIFVTAVTSVCATSNDFFFTETSCNITIQGFYSPEILRVCYFSIALTCATAKGERKRGASANPEKRARELSVKCDRACRPRVRTSLLPPVSRPGKQAMTVFGSPHHY